ncbi:hypothetical protein OAC41_05675 [Acidimicrobiales bacterium]|nr:hypothetical protein [Acidimicrobiales bacterium]
MPALSATETARDIRLTVLDWTPRCVIALELAAGDLGKGRWFVDKVGVIGLWRNMPLAFGVKRSAAIVLPSSTAGLMSWRSDRDKLLGSPSTTCLGNVTLINEEPRS